MKVLILSPYPEEIIKVLKKYDDEFLIYNQQIDISFLKKNNVEFIISFGYKFIIQENIVNQYKDKIINLHISFLPFNRGSYPNLWSHLEGSPSGVSIHKINEGLDKGEILLQKKIIFDNKKHTLKSSYLILKEEIQELFKLNWKLLRKGKIPGKESIVKGSYKSKKDGDDILRLLNDGWDTKIYKAVKIYKNNLINKSNSAIN